MEEMVAKLISNVSQSGCCPVVVDVAAALFAGKMSFHTGKQFLLASYID